MNNRKNTKSDKKAKKERQKLMVLAVLGLVGGGLWIKPMLQSGPAPAKADSKPDSTIKAPSKPPAQAEPKVAMAVDLDAPLVLFSLVPGSYARKDIGMQDKPRIQPRDENTLRPSAEAMLRQAADNLTLQGTIIGDPARALINGELFRVGDTIRGARIEAIQKNRIILQMNGAQIALTM